MYIVILNHIYSDNLIEILYIGKLIIHMETRVHQFFTFNMVIIPPFFQHVVNIILLYIIYMLTKL